MRAVCAKPASRSADLAVSATKVAWVGLGSGVGPGLGSGVGPGLGCGLGLGLGVGLEATKVASVSLACASARLLVHALIPEEALAELGVGGKGRGRG